MRARCLNNLGSAWRKLGEAEKALSYFEAALALKQAMGDQQGEAQTWFNIGQLKGNQGDELAAASAYEKARVMFEELGLPAPAARCERALSRVLERLQD